MPCHAALRDAKSPHVAKTHEKSQNLSVWRDIGIWHCATPCAASLSGTTGDCNIVPAACPSKQTSSVMCAGCASVMPSIQRRDRACPAALHSARPRPPVITSYIKCRIARRRRYTALHLPSTCASTGPRLWRVRDESRRRPAPDLPLLPQRQEVVTHESGLLTSPAALKTPFAGPRRAFPTRRNGSPVGPLVSEGGRPEAHL